MRECTIHIVQELKADVYLYSFGSELFDIPILVYIDHFIYDVYAVLCFKIGQIYENRLWTVLTYSTAAA